MKKSTKVKFTRTSDYITTEPDYQMHETKIIQNRKEDHYNGGLLAVAKVNKPERYNLGGMSAVIDCRFYGSGSRVYCCVWLNFPSSKRHPDGIHVSGGGYAGGYGYDKKSAALASALEQAGVKLPWSLSGTGENERAMLETCAAAGFKNSTIISAHG
jgi:hypothetical protein